MYKKTMTYTDFNGVERTEDLYFNLTKAELTELDLFTEGGLKQKLVKIVNTKDVPTLARTFKEIIKQSYGVKSDDGRRFIKSEEVFNEFAQTQMYSDLFMQLATDSNMAAEFINHIMPADLVDKISNDDIKKQFKEEIPGIDQIVDNAQFNA